MAAIYNRDASAVSHGLFGHGLLSPLPAGEGEGEGLLSTRHGALTPRPLPLGERARGACRPCSKRWLDDALVGMHIDAGARWGAGPQRRPHR